MYHVLSNGNYAIYAEDYDALPADTNVPACKAVNDSTIHDGAQLEVHDKASGKITKYAQALQGAWFER